MSTTEHLGFPYQPGAAPDESLDTEVVVVDDPPVVDEPATESLDTEPTEKPKAKKETAKKKS